MSMRSQFRACLVCALITGLVGTAGRAAAEEPTPPVQAAATDAEKAPLADAVASAQEPVPHGGETHTGFKALFKDLAGDTRHLVDREPLFWLTFGGAEALIFHPLDENVNKHFQNSFSDGFWKPGKILGYGAVQIGAAVGTWAYGRATERHGKVAHIGLDLLRAQLVTQGITYGLKYTVRRDRPDLTDGYSFPSGHASTTFATASVLESHLGWKWGLPTYALSTYVAASRLHENRHWLSDVIFGGALGMAAGRSVARHGRNNYALVPMAVPDGIGVAITRVTAP